MIDLDSDDNSDEGSGFESEELDRPRFVPKQQRITLDEKQRQLDEDRLRAEKKDLEQRLKKEKTRAEVAENIRKMTEGVDHSDANGYDSERGLPDCSDDKMDLQLEVLLLLLMMLCIL